MSENKNNNYAGNMQNKNLNVGKELDPVKKSDESNKQSEKEKDKKEKESENVKIKFKQNRKFDLHIGREMLTFLGRQEKEIPRRWLTHKDWDSIKNYFIVSKGE